MAELWWLPSLIVFGIAGAGVAATVAGLRRRGARRTRAELDSGRRLEIVAKGLIVRADDAVREARHEIGYADAQFGPRAAARLREAVEQAERMLREALVLQQRLDDAEPDTAAERRTLATRIADACRRAIELLEEAEQALSSARAAERGVAEGIPELRDGVVALERRCADAAAAIARLGERFAPSALASAGADVERAQAALSAARAELDQAARSRGAADARAAADVGGVGLDAGAGTDVSAVAGPGAVEGAGPGVAVAPLLGRAADRLQQAARHLDRAERVELRLAAAVDETRAERAALDQELAAARRERDALATGPDSAEAGVAAAAAALGDAVGEASALLVSPRDGRDDPFARRDLLRAVRDRLDAVRADARRAAGRLDGARSALGGAIAIAESQLGVARGLIERGRGTVGADARTRLAEAERQLAIARQEPDPVAALDAARRASARASDAEALARYDGSRGGA